MLLYFGHELFDLLRVFCGANESGFGGVDDDEVVAVDGGDQVAGLFADDEDVGGAEMLGERLGDAIAAGVGGKGFTESGPATDVEPFHRHRDGGDVRGFFHDGKIDRDFGERGIDGIEDFVLLRRIPGFGDFHQAGVAFGEMLLDLIKNGFGFPDEHAGVPGVGAGGEILLGGLFIGFFLEGFDHEDAGRIGERLAALDVAEAGRGEGGGDTEGDEIFGVFFDGVEGSVEGVLEDVEGLDDMVGGEDGEGGVRVALMEDGGGEADGVGGVAAGRFAEELGFGEEGEVGEDLPGDGTAGADVDAGGINESAEAAGGDLQERLCGRAAFACNETKQLFGLSRPRHGP